MSKIEVKNARIESTHLGKEGHGIMTCMIMLDYGGAGQGFGGWSLGGEWGMEYINKVLEVTGVECWEDLPGTHVRVKAEQMKVHAIGHILRDKWFDPAEDLKEYLPKEAQANDRDTD